MVDVKSFKELVGRNEHDAKAYVEARGGVFRVVTRDGTPLAITDDINPNRVNVAIIGDEVSSVVSLGK